MTLKTTAALLIPMLVCSCAPSAWNTTKKHGEPSRLVDDHGRTLGCSWYCGSPRITVTATDTLRDGVESYEPRLVHDTRKDTVWAAGGANHGIGSKLIFTFDCTGERGRRLNGRGIDSLSLINGFARTPELWSANSRVKKFRISFNGRGYGTLVAADTMTPQSLRLPKLKFVPGIRNRLVLEIAEVYPGRTRDTCVADIRFDGFGAGH